MKTSYRNALKARIISFLKEFDFQALGWDGEEVDVFGKDEPGVGDPMTVREFRKNSPTRTRIDELTTMIKSHRMKPFRINITGQVFGEF